MQHTDGMAAESPHVLEKYDKFAVKMRVLCTHVRIIRRLRCGWQAVQQKCTVKMHGKCVLENVCTGPVRGNVAITEVNGNQRKSTGAKAETVYKHNRRIYRNLDSLAVVPNILSLTPHVLEV